MAYLSGSVCAGTSAQQLDASFSTNASLELFELDLADPSLDMKSCGSLSSTHRWRRVSLHRHCWLSSPVCVCCVCVLPFLLSRLIYFLFFASHRYHKLVWGPYGMDAQGHPSGVLIAGGENGNVILYDAAKIMAGESDVIVAESVRHTGPVRALDVNHFQVRSRPALRIVFFLNYLPFSSNEKNIHAF